MLQYFRSQQNPANRHEALVHLGSIQQRHHFPQNLQLIRLATPYGHSSGSFIDVYILGLVLQFGLLYGTVECNAWLGPLGSSLTFARISCSSGKSGSNHFIDDSSSHYSKGLDSGLTTLAMSKLTFVSNPVMSGPVCPSVLISAHSQAEHERRSPSVRLPYGQGIQPSSNIINLLLSLFHHRTVVRIRYPGIRGAML